MSGFEDSGVFYYVAQDSNLASSPISLVYRDSLSRSASVVTPTLVKSIIPKLSSIPSVLSPKSSISRTCSNSSFSSNIGDTDNEDSNDEVSSLSKL